MPFQVSDCMSDRVYPVGGPVEAAELIRALFNKEYSDVAPASMDYMTAYYCFEELSEDGWECACRSLDSRLVKAATMIPN